MSNIDEELYQLSNRRKDSGKHSRSRSFHSSKKHKRSKRDYSDSEEDESQSDDYSDYSSDSPSHKSHRSHRSQKSRDLTDSDYSSNDEDLSGEDSRQRSDSDADLDKFDDGFDDNLLGDSADRQYLLSLPEVEREKILTERFEKRKELKATFEFKKSLRLQQKKDGGSDKRNSRKSIIKGGKTKEDALNKLRESRNRSHEQRHQRSRHEEDEHDEYRSKGSSSHDYGRASSSSSREAAVDNSEAARALSRKGHHLDNFKDGGSDSTKPHSSRPEPLDREDLEVATPSELDPAILKRGVLEKWLGEPYFDAIVTGSFVRLLIGSNPAASSSDLTHVYRLAKITAVEEGPKKYKVGKKDTNKVLVLEHGNAKKAFRLDLISNQPTTQSEFSKWVREMKRCQLSIPSIKEATAQFRQQKDFIKNFVYTGEQIEKILEEKSKLNIKKKDLSKEKAYWSSKLQYALDESNDTNAEEARRKLQDIEQTIKTKKEAVHSNVSIASINIKNRVKNIKQEFKKNVTFDAFNRRPTYPSLLSPSVIEEIEKQKEKERAQEKEPPAPAPLTAESSRTSSPLEDFPELVNENLLKDAHNFHLDIDIGATKTPVLKKRPATSMESIASAPPNAKRLSLADYKKRVGSV